MTRPEKSTLKNEKHYDKVYSEINIQHILNKIENLEDFMTDATQTDTSWISLYHDNFQNQLKGKKVLELGCGDFTNAAVIAVLAQRFMQTIFLKKSGEIIKKLNVNHKFD